MTHAARLLAVTVITLLASSQPAFAAITYFTWETASGGNGHRYGLTETTGDWNASNLIATQEGGHLATITSAAEQQFIRDTFSMASTNEPFWLGATDLATEGVFEWTTGEDFLYTNWKRSEPSGTTSENYLTINWESVRGRPGTWNDTPLNGTFGFDSGVNDGPYRGIVEVTAVPEPSSVGVMASLLACYSGLQRRRK